METRPPDAAHAGMPWPRNQEDGRIRALPAEAGGPPMENNRPCSKEEAIREETEIQTPEKRRAGRRGGRGEVALSGLARARWRGTASGTRTSGPRLEPDQPPRPAARRWDTHSEDRREPRSFQKVPGLWTPGSEEAQPSTESGSRLQPPARLPLSPDPRVACRSAGPGRAAASGEKQPGQGRGHLPERRHETPFSSGSS